MRAVRTIPEWTVSALGEVGESWVESGPGITEAPRWCWPRLELQVPCCCSWFCRCPFCRKTLFWALRCCSKTVTGLRMDLCGSRGEIGSSMLEAGDSIGVADAKCTTMFPARTSDGCLMVEQLGFGFFCRKHLLSADLMVQVLKKLTCDISWILQMFLFFSAVRAEPCWTSAWVRKTQCQLVFAHHM